MKKSRSLALISAGLVAGLVLGSLGVSYAATASETTSPVLGAGIRMGHAIRDAGARLVDVLADLTGLSVDEIKAQRAEGDSIAEIAEANGVSADAVVDGALEVRREVLDAKVADGTITQEQADAAYARMTERLSERATSDEVGPPSWAGSGGKGQGGKRAGAMGGPGMGRGGNGACDGSCIATP